MLASIMRVNEKTGGYDERLQNLSIGRLENLFSKVFREYYRIRILPSLPFLPNSDPWNKDIYFNQPRVNSNNNILYITRAW